MKTLLAGLAVTLAASLVVAAPIPRQAIVLPQAPPPKEANQGLVEPYSYPEEEQQSKIPDPLKEPLASDVLMAYTLLTQSSDIPLPEQISDELIEALYYICVKEELIDQRETWFFTGDQDTRKEGIRNAQARYYEGKDYPKLCEAGRFPPTDVAARLKEFNRAYHTNIKNRIPWEKDREDLILVVMDECDYCYRLWDNIQDANSQWQYTFTRRKSLAYLKKEMGEAYEKGEMPPYVPHWRFVPLN